MINDKTSTEDRVPGYPVAPVLQFLSPLLHKVLTIATIELLVRKGGDGVECELGHEALVEPIVMLVAATDCGALTIV